jgi:hypothetical protein
MQPSQQLPQVKRIAAALTAGLLAVFALAARDAYAEDALPQPACVMRFSVELTPDIPNPRDGGFISSLLGDHPGYQLTLRRVVDDTHIDLQLYGPGPDESCGDVLASMSKDGRVVAIQTL